MDQSDPWALPTHLQSLRGWGSVLLYKSELDEKNSNPFNMMHFWVDFLLKQDGVGQNT
jgi:hypothetical protein